MPRVLVLPKRVAWCVAALSVLFTAPGRAQSPPPFPLRDAESAEFRARLHAAAADPRLAPWQREYMQGFAGAGAARGMSAAAPRVIGTPDASGEWDELPPPTARIEHTAIYDPVRDRMVVFGGTDGSSRNDVWALSLAGTPVWTPLGTTGTPPTGRYGHSAIYDPVRDRMIVFGGYDGSSKNDVWALSLAGQPSWSALSPTGAPPTGRYSHSAIYDPVRDRMLVFGGTGSGSFNDVWALNLADQPSWTALSPTGTVPPARFDHSAIYDPVRDQMVVFGGDAGSFSYLNDAWALSLAGTPAWSDLSPAGTLPTARRGHTAIYDPVRDRMVMFGGSDGSLLNDSWALSLAGPSSWSALSPTGTLPVARAYEAGIYDPVRDRIVVFGGYGGYYRNDVEALGLADQTSWSELGPSGTWETARSGHTAIYDPVRDRMIVFGGVGGSIRNDVWALDLAGTLTWSALSPTGTPPSARSGHSAIYDPVRDRMIVFGGSDDYGLRNDVWALSLSGAPAWSTLSPTGTPPSARAFHAAIYDPVRDQMVVCGGYDGSGRNDVWALSLGDAPAWNALSPTGALPTARYAHTAIYDPVRDRVVVFGGYNGPGLNDVWALSLAGTPSWSALSPMGLPPVPRYLHTAIYDPLRDRMIVFGGDGGFVTYGNDSWALGLADPPTWSALGPAGILPTARSAHTAIYDPVRDRMVVFGGSDGGPAFNDVQLLRWDLTPVGVPPLAIHGAGLGSPFPNPTREAISIHFDLPAAMPVRVAMYDVAGRLVQLVADRPMPAGGNTLNWAMGRGGNRRVSPGLYYCRVRLGEREFTRSVVVVR